jgi:hypothetical protein
MSGRSPDKGFLHKDKAVELQKKERAEAKHGRRTGVPTTLAEFMVIAASTIVRNDPLWEEAAIVQRKRDLETLAGLNFWKRLKVKGLKEMDNFINVLRVVLPHLWVKLLEDGVVKLLEDGLKYKTIKADVLKKLIPYLALVNKVADKVVAPSILLPDVDISDMKRTDILALFVKQDDTEYLINARAATKKMHTLRSALIASCDTDIDERYVVVPPRGVEDVDSEDEDEDEDDDNNNDDNNSDDDDLFVDLLEKLNDMV